MLRFALNPTKHIDIGDLRVALFNYILAKQLDKQLLIRIDDINQDKNIQNQEKEILEILNLFSIDYINIAYQNSTIKQDLKMAMQLLMQKKAFSCFCTDDMIEKSYQKAKKNNKIYNYDGGCDKLDDAVVINTEAPFTVRIKAPKDDIKFTDLLKGKIKYTSEQIDSFIILTKDKIPTSNFASAIDDMIYDISTIIIDEKDIDNTPKQIHIRESLGYTKQIDYLHIPSISNIKPDDKKFYVSELIELGFLPVAIANYLVLLGNNTPTRIFTLEEAINWFDIKNLTNENIEFDIEELKQINKEHMKMLDNMRFSKILGYADEDFGKLAKLYIDEACTIKNIKEKIDAILAPKKLPSDFTKEFEIIKQCLKDAPYIDNYDEFIQYIKNKTNLEDKSLFKPLRYILTAKQDNLDLAKIYPLIKNYLGEIIK
jgi:glutamyl-tRNA synthetase